MQVASKKAYWKNNSVPNTCDISPLKKIFFSELNKYIFQISLKYIKLVITKILFILVLSNFNFYFKITCTSPPNNITPHQSKSFWPSMKDFSKIFNPSPFPQAGGGACHDNIFHRNARVTKVWSHDLIHNISESRNKILLVTSWTDIMTL